MTLLSAGGRDGRSPCQPGDGRGKAASSAPGHLLMVTPNGAGLGRERPVEAPEPRHRAGPYAAILAPR
jgi:hypothetical protein